MNWKEIESAIPKTIEQLKEEYTIPNVIIRDDIFRILEEQCVVVYYPLEGETNWGFHIKKFVKNEYKDFVYINTARPFSEQVFGAAHELGHVWNVVEKVQAELENSEELDPELEESIINRFAAELLMPEQEVVKGYDALKQQYSMETEKSNLEILLSIIVRQMNDFMVPYDTVRKRLLEVKKISVDINCVLKEHEKQIKILIDILNQDQNTMLDQTTNKKLIPGMRGMIETIERDGLLDEYRIAKIKKDFEMSDFKMPEGKTNISL